MSSTSHFVFPLSFMKRPSTAYNLNHSLKGQRTRTLMMCTWTSCETSTARHHQFCNSIKTVKNSNLGEGARQGDISPKLFTSWLQHAIINKINWENKGVRIDGEYLTHLIFCRWYSPHSQSYIKATGNAARYPWHQQASRP